MNEKPKSTGKPEPPWIVVRTRVGEKFHSVEFRIPEIRLGRSSKCEIFLRDKKASRNHASIERTDEGALLLDQASANGTRCNGWKVLRTFLKKGDIIEIGDTNIEVISVIPSVQKDGAGPEAKAAAPEPKKPAKPEKAVTPTKPQPKPAVAPPAKAAAPASGSKKPAKAWKSVAPPQKVKPRPKPAVAPAPKPAVPAPEPKKEATPPEDATPQPKEAAAPAPEPEKEVTPPKDAPPQPKEDKEDSKPQGEAVRETPPSE